MALIWNMLVGENMLNFIIVTKFVNTLDVYLKHSMCFAFYTDIYNTEVLSVLFRVIDKIRSPNPVCINVCVSACICGFCAFSLTIFLSLFCLFFLLLVCLLSYFIIMF